MPSVVTIAFVQMKMAPALTAKHKILLLELAL